MSSQDEYARPLYRITSTMARQMAQEDNLAKKSWLGPEKTVETLREDLSRNLNKFELARSSGNSEEMWRRAANVANFLWMIAHRSDHDHGPDAPHD